MKHNKPHFRIGRIINITWLPKEERIAIRKAHPSPSGRLYETREEAEAANPDPDIFKVFECASTSLCIGGF